MVGNTFGKYLGDQTKNLQRSLRKRLAFEEAGRRNEIVNNQSIWFITLAYLKSVDPEWEVWYDSPAIPDEIEWTGRGFQNVLHILWERIREVRCKE